MDFLGRYSTYLLLIVFFVFVAQETLKRKEAEQEKRLEMGAAKLEEAKSQAAFLKDQMAAARYRYLPT